MTRNIRERIRFFVKFIVFLAIIFVQVVYPNLQKEFEMPRRYIDATIYFITAYLFISFGKLLIIEIYVRGKKIHEDAQDNFILGVTRISSLFNTIAFLLSMFVWFDVDVMKFLTSISIVAAAIAVITKDYISNMINGMIIMFSDRLSLNDRIGIGEHKGKITDITFLHTHIVNDDDDLIYIPNNVILNSEITNYTKRIVNKISVDIEVAYKHLESIEKLEEHLISMLEPYKDLYINDSPSLKTVKINSDSAHLKFQFVMKQHDKEKERMLRRLTYRSVVAYIKKKDAKSKQEKLSE